MSYDLELIADLCRELYLPVFPRSSNRVAVELGEGVVLVFVNGGSEDDSYVGFEDVGWHYHDDLTRVDRSGCEVELGYMDVLIGLAEGRVPLCEHWRQGELRERSLVLRDFVDEFHYLREDDEVRIRRARVRRE